MFVRYPIGNGIALYGGLLTGLLWLFLVLTWGMLVGAYWLCVLTVRAGIALARAIRRSRHGYVSPTV